jgi:fluoroquinolone transport system permease protein
MRSRLIAARPLARTIRWPALAASVVPGLWFVWKTSSDPAGNAEGAAIALRLGAVSLAIGMAFVLDDPSEDLTAPAPVSLLARRALRIAVTLPAAVVAWLVLVSLANGASYLAEPVHAAPLLVEMVALTLVALAGAGVGARRLADGLGGPAGAGAVVMVALVGAILPWGEGGSLLTVVPGTPEYADVRGWWWGLLALAIAALVSSSRTPPGTRLLRLLREVWRSGVAERR